MIQFIFTKYYFLEIRSKINYTFEREESNNVVHFQETKHRTIELIVIAR